MEMVPFTPHRPASNRWHRFASALALTGFATLSACATSPAPAPQASLPAAPAPRPQAPPPPPALPQLVDAGPQLRGTASWYRPGPGLHRTCTGETFTRDQLTAASHSIPVGTQVRVALLDQSRSVVVRINDCMPRGHRILDLSEAAADELGLVRMGIARVTVTPVILASGP